MSLESERIFPVTSFLRGSVKPQPPTWFPPSKILNSRGELYCGSLGRIRSWSMVGRVKPFSTCEALSNSVLYVHKGSLVENHEEELRSNTIICDINLFLLLYYVPIKLLFPWTMQQLPKLGMQL